MVLEDIGQQRLIPSSATMLQQLWDQGRDVWPKMNVLRCKWVEHAYQTLEGDEGMPNLLAPVNAHNSFQHFKVLLDNLMCHECPAATYAAETP